MSHASFVLSWLAIGAGSALVSLYGVRAQVLLGRKHWTTRREAMESLCTVTALDLAWIVAGALFAPVAVAFATICAVMFTVVTLGELLTALGKRLAGRTLFRVCPRKRTPSDLESLIKEELRKHEWSHGYVGDKAGLTKQIADVVRNARS